MPEGAPAAVAVVPSGVPNVVRSRTVRTVGPAVIWNWTSWQEVTRNTAERNVVCVSGTLLNWIVGVISSTSTVEHVQRAERANASSADETSWMMFSISAQAG